jgi:hypothetical protein
VRYFFTRREPPATRILLVESGNRGIFEGLISGIRKSYGEEIFVDLVTCFAGLPRGFNPERTRVYRVGDYRTGAARQQLFAELARNGYSILGIICSGEPVMTKWKWVLAARVPAKVFVLNENGDYFWMDRTNWRTMLGFVLFRAGLTGAGAVRTLARMFLFPFTLMYLLLYASTVHCRRALRRG